MEAWHPTVLLGKKARRSSALRTDQRRQRQTDKLQILSWNAGFARGSDPSLLASHLNGPWHVICIQEGSCFVTDSSLAENFHVTTQHHCAVLVHQDTSARDFSCTPIQVRSSLRFSSRGAEGMVAFGQFRRAFDPSCAFFQGCQRSHRQRVRQAEV